MNPNKRPPPSSVGAFEGGDGLRDATKRARDFPDGKILRPGQEQPGNVLLVRVTDIVHPVSCKKAFGKRRLEIQNKTSMNSVFVVSGGLGRIL